MKEFWKITELPSRKSFASSRLLSKKYEAIIETYFLY
jgi:hypothetical protein